MHLPGKTRRTFIRELLEIMEREEKFVDQGNALLAKANFLAHTIEERVRTALSGSDATQPPFGCAPHGQQT
jgi:uncharacterized protein (DUF362 family)